MHECLRCIKDETVGFHRNEDDTLLICDTDNHKARYVRTGGSASLESSMDDLFLNCPKKNEFLIKVTTEEV